MVWFWGEENWHVAFWNFGKKKTPQELMAAGNYKAALKGFQELLKTRKSDPVLFMNVADLYMKMGHKDKARTYYIKVGEFYGEQGFFNKAVAVFKKALNITPGDKEILTKLAGYNNKVPKYILDSSFLERAGDGNREKKKAEPKAEAPPVVEEVSTPPTQDEAPQSVEAQEPQTIQSVEEPEAALSEPVAAPSETEKELAEDTLPSAVEAESAEDYEDIDFDTLTDLTDALTEEFENTDFPLASGKSAKSAPQPTAEPQSKPKPVTEDTTPGLGLEANNIVFSSRPTELGNKDDDREMDFSSLDDALDCLFAPDSPALEQEQEQQRKHWALFRTMPEDMFMDFVIALETRDFEPGKFIVEQGNPGDEMFLIADGEVEVLLNRGENMDRVATLGEGDFFGEASLLTGAPRNASVKTMTATSCLLLKQAHLHELARSHPSVTQSIESIYQARLRQNEQK